MATTAVPTRRRAQVPFGKRLLAALPDASLVDHIRAGDERAFEVVYDRYHRGLLAFCRHMLGSADEAEDALQQTFVSAHADLLRGRRDLALKAWLYTIARNRCLSMLRARREHAAELVEPATVGLAEQVESRAELRAMLADVAQLPERQRTAILLAEVGDLSHAEIGEVIGCEAGKVKALIFQARSALIDARRARDTPCTEIREQLAIARGGELRRGELRRHLKVCKGCSEFRDEVRRQRAMLAVALPVLPSLALKRSVLAAAGAGSGSGAGGAGLAAGVAVKGGVAKLIAIGALGTAAVGGGVALEESGTLTPNHNHAKPPAAAPAHAVAPPGLTTVAAPKAQAPAAVPPATSHPAPQTRHHGAATPKAKHPHKAHVHTPAKIHTPNNAVGKTHSELKRENGTINSNGHATVPPQQKPSTPPRATPDPPKSKAPAVVPPVPTPQIPGPTSGTRPQATPPDLSGG